MISAGDLEAARFVAERNVRELAELAREGCPIVCTEPSSALCLKHEYPMILNNPDVDMVASQVVDAGAYLLGLHRAGQLKTDFQPLDLDVGPLQSANGVREYVSFKNRQRVSSPFDHKIRTLVAPSAHSPSAD